MNENLKPPFRVRLSKQYVEARSKVKIRRFRRFSDPNREGTVKSISPDGKSWRVIWDGTKTVQTYFASILTILDEKVSDSEPGDLWIS